MKAVSSEFSPQPRECSRWKNKPSFDGSFEKGTDKNVCAFLFIPFFYETCCKVVALGRALTVIYVRAFAVKDLT